MMNTRFYKEKTHFLDFSNPIFPWQRNYGTFFIKGVAFSIGWGSDILFISSGGIRGHDFSQLSVFVKIIYCLILNERRS